MSPVSSQTIIIFLKRILRIKDFLTKIRDSSETDFCMIYAKRTPFDLVLSCLFFQAELDQYSSALLDAGADLAPLEFIKKWR